MTIQPPPISVVSERVAALRNVIAELRGNPNDVRIVAVTKSFDVAAWKLAAQTGCDGIGENYAQELLDKVGRLGAPVPLPLHFIGHLQSNKIKALAPHVALWHTVDRVSVAAALAKQAEREETTHRVLIQVNSTGEDQKSGCAPHEVEHLVDSAQSGGLDVVGLMTMGPTSAELEPTRAAFRATARLAAGLGLPELSMGMSHDVRIAIEEGATIVRVGSGLFGERPRTD